MKPQNVNIVARTNRKEKKDMAGNHEDRNNYGKDSSERTLQDYFIPVIKVIDNINYPLVETRSFELKSTLVNMMQNAGQFRRLPTEKPLAHLKKFSHFVDMVRINNVPINAIRLRLFLFSLADEA
ncbi:hypothetical protein CR513_21955, partial [Mucuna pruriens]